MKKKPIEISTFTHDEQDLDVLYAKGKIQYVFMFKDKRYGGAVKLKSTKGQDIANAAFALAINYLEAYAKVKKANQ